MSKPHSVIDIGAVTAPGEVIDAARYFVQTHGLNRAAKMLGTGRQSLAATCAGLPVRRGTVALVTQGLALARTSETEPPLTAA